MVESYRRCAGAMKFRWLVAVKGLFVTTVVLAAAPALALADAARFNIPAGSMASALREFAAQAHMQLLYKHEVVAHVMANAVIGELDKHAALEQLLRNTGLEAVYSSADSVTIRPVHGLVPVQPPATPSSRRY